MSIITKVSRLNVTLIRLLLINSLSSLRLLIYLKSKILSKVTEVMAS